MQVQGHPTQAEDIIAATDHLQSELSVDIIRCSCLKRSTTRKHTKWWFWAPGSFYLPSALKYISRSLSKYARSRPQDKGFRMKVFVIWQIRDQWCADIIMMIMIIFIMVTVTIIMTMITLITITIVTLRRLFFAWFSSLPVLRLKRVVVLRLWGGGARWKQDENDNEDDLDEFYNHDNWNTWCARLLGKGLTG